MASAARERAAQETYHALSPLLGGKRKEQLDRLLVPDPTKKGTATELSWLRRGTTSNTPRAIAEQLQKLSRLRELSADRLDVGAVNPNRLKFLANLGRRYTNQELQRQASGSCYLVLLAFLKEAHTELVDEVHDLVDQCLAQADARSRRELEEFRRGAARATNEKVKLFGDLARIVLDPEVADADVRAAALGRVGSEEELHRAVEEAESLARPLDDNYYDFLADKYVYVRQFAPAFLRAFEFRSNGADDVLVEAVSLLKEVNASGSRRVPEGAPLGFAPAKWLPYLADKDGRIDRRQWELCLF